MFRSLRRISIAIVLALPGVGLAFCAIPLVLGETALLVGLALAFALPALWLITERPRRSSELPSSETGGDGRTRRCI
jgi:hypothetical protein